MLLKTMGVKSSGNVSRAVLCRDLDYRTGRRNGEKKREKIFKGLYVYVVYIASVFIQFVCICVSNKKQVHKKKEFILEWLNVKCFEMSDVFVLYFKKLNWILNYPEKWKTINLPCLKYYSFWSCLHLRQQTIWI